MYMHRISDDSVQTAVLKIVVINVHMALSTVLDLHMFLVNVCGNYRNKLCC
jgi:hypothetical protein